MHEQYREREQETASLKKIDDSFKKIVIVRKHIPKLTIMMVFYTLE